MHNAEILPQWAELLLDTGKRNNLVNFRDTKATTVEVLMPSAPELFDELEGNALEIFEPKVDGDDGEQSQKKEADRIALLKDLYNKEVSKSKKKKKVLVYNVSTDPLRVISNIERKNRSFIEETGVNVAHIAYGFVHWKESKDPHTTYCAPILLMPISIEHDSAVAPYYIKSADDTIMVNPTFSYKLETEYKSKLPEYKDEEGVDKYIQTVGEVVSKLNLGWTVSSECKIGLFSFQKFIMYRDLMDNPDTILKNSNVQSLLGGDDGESSDETNNLSDDGICKVSNPLTELHNVVDADASQIEAIIAAISGKSFVLQGPPGTGKSQTITNIIAELLSEKKKVLFVSEKMAALNVVYDQLSKAGLSEFCLELHSHKANKKSVIADICSTLRAPKSEISSKADEEKKSEASAQKDLDEYVIELHQERDVIQKSLFQLYEAFSALRNYAPIEWEINDIQDKGSEYLDEVSSLLDQYVSYLPSIGNDYTKNVWYGYIGIEDPIHAQAYLKKGLKALCDMLRTLVPFLKEMSDIEGLSPMTVSELPYWKEVFTFASSSVVLKSRVLREDECDLVASLLEQLRALSEDTRQIKTDIDAFFTADIYEIDGASCQAQLTQQFRGFFSRLFSAEYRSLIRALRCCKRDRSRIKYGDALSMTMKLEAYQRQKREFAEKEVEINNVLGKAYNSQHPEWERLGGEVSTLKRLLSQADDKERFSTIVKYAFANERFSAYASTLKEALAKCGEDVWKSLAHLFNKEVFDILNGSCENTMQGCEHRLQHIELFGNWYHFCRLMDDLEKKEVLPFIELVIANSIAPEQIVGAFKRSFYLQWINMIILSSPTISRLNRIGHDQKTQIFREKDKKQHDINKARIRAALSDNRPSTSMVVPGSPLSILLSEGVKKRRQRSIRSLLQVAGPLVQNIKPCFLMSPLSVSTFLTPGSVHFDTVVFDEASQVFPQDAIGAIYRADQLIVVGDSKQMPPTNFFTTTTDRDDDLDEDNDNDISLYDSILDKCSIFMPQYRLSWHYRSRCEQLIAFSNKNFYGNTLITFPSCKTDRKGIGIDYYHVDGTFDRKSHTNQIEAEHVVQLIYEHIHSHPERSLGVVAFSVAQQNLIDRLLYERRCKEPKMEYFFRQDRIEPFFIKNLESVQGDERDTIIFSIAYGKDSTGRLLLNFGPLNKEGGERRLNVAVTRAKLNVQVVASMRCQDIDLSRSDAEGVRLLREYLDYAENGQGVLERSVSVESNDEVDYDFEMEVCEFLRAQGYEVDTQVGCSGCRIDLGLKRPNTSDYLLAIECDGPTYHSSRNARDRDRLRQEVLERMGWKFYRIWSTDWFRNTKEEQRLLLEAITKEIASLNETKVISQEIPFEDTSYEVIASQSVPTFLTYEAADSEELMRLHDEKKTFEDFMIAVLEKEAPLSEEFFLKRTSWLWGKDKVSPEVRQRFDALMYDCGKYGITRKNGFLYLTDKPVAFRSQGNIERDIKHIAPEEIAAGLLQIIQQNGSVKKDALYRTLASFCGIKRNGKIVCEHFDAALNLLLGSVEIQGDVISLKHH